VLIVENDSLTCDVIEFVIQSTVPDCKVQLAACLRDATAMLESQEFDLVIADLGLPDSRGVETAAALRTQSGCDIMLYSAALNDPHVMIEARQAGFEHCVPKRADNRGIVRQCIRELLDTVH
jgi:CheY-like chemotaxis protein